MDNLRLVLVFSLAFVMLLLYQAWVQDYGSSISSETTYNQTAPEEKNLKAIEPEKDYVPDIEVASEYTTDSDTLNTSSLEKAPFVKVETDLFKLNISTRGGTIQDLKLLNYPIDPKNPDVKFQLLKPDTPNLYLAQSGLISTDKSSAPTHEVNYKAEKNYYNLENGEENLSVEMVWENPIGIKVTKTFRLKRGSYLIGLEHKVENNSNESWTARSYVQIQRSEHYDPNESSFLYTYNGAAFYTPELKYEKIPFDDFKEYKKEIEFRDGWIAILQHYFLSAWIPTKTEQHTIYTRLLSGPRYVIGTYSNATTVSPGSTHSFNTQFFSGPKLQNELASVAEGLELAVDYGWLTILAQPIFWLLDHLHSLVGNWGVAIILLTLLIKLVFYKLSETSYRSMANMRKLTPRLQALKDRYGDDKERLNQAMMDLYKKEKINPLGGCLPILVQIPVFIALYWVLLESVELRHAPFALWIDNLSDPDPYFILPLVMGISMFVQQKLNPAPVDPLQAKIMMSLPIVFTVFFAFFPAGLVLYWTVNNLLSIAQQWYITKAIEKA